MGQCDMSGRPHGVVRAIYRDGELYEGEMSRDGSCNGWGVRYCWEGDQIKVGWWNNNTLVGNCVITDYEWEVQTEGWFENGERVGPRKEDA